MEMYYFGNKNATEDSNSEINYLIMGYLQVTLLAIQKFKMQKINRNHEKSHILTHLLLWNIHNNASRNKEVKKYKKRRNKKHSNNLAKGIMSHFYLFH